MSVTSNLRRLQNEAKQLNNHNDDPEYNKMFKIKMVGDNIYKWVILLFGQPDTLYEGGVFKMEMSLSDNYPFSPPVVKFITPIDHVNINSNGDICLDILKNNWSPSQNVKSVITSIILLLSEPNFDDPFNPYLSNIHKQNINKYNEIIRQCCSKYNESTVEL